MLHTGVATDRASTAVSVVSVEGVEQCVQRKRAQPEMRRASAAEPLCMHGASGHPLISTVGFCGASTCSIWRENRSISESSLWRLIWKRREKSRDSGASTWRIHVRFEIVAYTTVELLHYSRRLVYSETMPRHYNQRSSPGKCSKRTAWQPTYSV